MLVCALSGCSDPREDDCDGSGVRVDAGADSLPPQDMLCFGPLVCDVAEGTCVIPRCSADSDCGYGFECNGMGVCRRSNCSVDGHCPVGMECLGLGDCALSSCASDADCPGDGACSFGDCIPRRCEVDRSLADVDDCPSGFRCTPTCEAMKYGGEICEYFCAEGCECDAECPGENLSCVGGHCQAPRCATDDDCPGRFCVPIWFDAYPWT